MTTSITGVRTDMSEILAKIKEFSSKTGVFTQAQPASDNSSSTGGAFEGVMKLVKTSVDKVNNIQQQAEQMQNAYSMGDKNVSLAEVVASTQTSRVALEGLMMVRNKILDAYKEIMSMPT